MLQLSLLYWGDRTTGEPYMTLRAYQCDLEQYNPTLIPESRGTAIYLYGGGSGSVPYQVTLHSDTESTPLPPSNGLLYSKGGLEQGIHTVNITAFPSPGQVFSFDEIVITDSIPAGTTSPPTLVQYDNSNVTAIQYVGDWSSKSDAHVPNPSHPAPFHITSTAGDYAALNFTEGVAVAINGSKNCGRGLYTVNLFDSSREILSSSQYNASTFWLVGDSLLYYRSGLDPNESYQIQLVNSARDDSVLTLNGFTIFQANGDTTSTSPTRVPLSPTSSGSDPSSPDISSAQHHVNAGVIVGPTLAGLALLALLALLITLIVIRRRKSAARRNADDIDPYSSDTRFDGPVYVAEKQQNHPSSDQSRYVSSFPSSAEPFSPSSTGPQVQAATSKAHILSQSPIAAASSDTPVTSSRPYMQASAPVVTAPPDTPAAPH
ncbi:hypothetical protein BXZ70DRAFT_1008697 [Cristinia sonorae]|uniref:Transmembrane protein n=1 Tax=Cristinia sonorae TaxID=1940300 RepID=A0A8K0UP42_9AGAR|nr:hypothetical protein BXZ70DRAFT_1008697 [Cristinia sonorae]